MLLQVEQSEVGTLEFAFPLAPLIFYPGFELGYFGLDGFLGGFHFVCVHFDLRLLNAAYRFVLLGLLLIQGGIYLLLVPAFNYFIALLAQASHLVLQVEKPYLELVVAVLVLVLVLVDDPAGLVLDVSPELPDKVPVLLEQQFVIL